MKFKTLHVTIGCCLAILLASVVLCFTQALYSVDKLISDPLYQIPSVPDGRIRIIGIDERTLAAYGDYSDWSREIPQRLVSMLNRDAATAPAVIAFDIMYVSERDAESDAAFAETCAEGNNVVTAANLVYHTEVTADENGICVDEDNIRMVEYPYTALKGASDYGFANAFLDRDNYIRFARLEAAYNGESIPSLPLAIYMKYAQTTGETVVRPETDGRGFYQFTYTGGSNTYEVLSLCDVLDGKIDPRVFAGSIVLVGAYAPGMQDNYSAAVQRGSLMYGVEIQANILEALMEGKTALPVSPLVMSVILSLLAIAYYLLSKRMKIVPAAILGVGMIAAYLAAARFFSLRGHILSVIEVLALIVLIYLAQLVSGYIAETLKKQRILGAFKQYVAPQVVQEVAEKGDFTITLGGEKRNIAVLFVDIRGFTPMSEGLRPEQVVEILNEYLSLTTSSIFKNGGTLDKFIGDATMAVFNAPFDLDDYIYRAVCTARDIAAGSEELERKLRERFGRSVSFGIGVNCGEAVVGNIGCDFRMDYTAIGDTVNTAARLESNAGRGQILISQSVYDAVKDRVRVTDVGVIPLKGKSNEVYVYQLDEVL